MELFLFKTLSQYTDPQLPDSKRWEPAGSTYAHQKIMELVSPDTRAFCENEKYKQNSFVSACHNCPAQLLGPELVEKDGSIPTGETKLLCIVLQLPTLASVIVICDNSNFKSSNLVPETVEQI